MEIMPSEYQNMELTRFDKMFTRYLISKDMYGFFLLKTNPTMIQDDYMHTLICEEGILFYKVFDKVEEVSKFEISMSYYIGSPHKISADTLSQRLKNNKALVGNDGRLKIPFNIVYVFPELERKVILESMLDEQLKKFIENHCLFIEDIQKFRKSLYEIAIKKFLDKPLESISEEKIRINDSNVNAILQRIAPEYVTIRVANIVSNESTPGASEEMLIVSSNDEAAKAFRLDDEQINIINKITKGDQLILACAGSGKSVLLISKCFKAAQMNPNKKFLITCYNKKLQSLYGWFIEKAGLRNKNVECMTFHKLCRTLLNEVGVQTHGSEFENEVNMVIQCLNSDQIQKRYYGIFIDEVQQFESEWYKLCYNLIENKDSNDHIFVICGDKTQKLTKQQKRGKAPWNVGEGYPNYRGGNKNIRIEKNYRNCIEVNEYINRFVANVKKYLTSIHDDYILDPDMFLRGQSVFHGEGVTLKKVSPQCNHEEAKVIIESIKKIHDENEIPYDEIAVIMYNSTYSGKIPYWLDHQYNLETPLFAKLLEEQIPYCKMYGSDDGGWGELYGDKGGVRLIKTASVLGLDFRACIVCGLIPMGLHTKTKKVNWQIIKQNDDLFADLFEKTEQCIRSLYVSCTRAKEILHIILPESKATSVYVKLLAEANE